MDGKILARLGAVVFVGVALTTTVIEATRRDEAVAVPAAAPERGATDTLRPVLRRCRDMGEAAIRDRTCLHAWAENRSRFLKQHDAPSNSGMAMTPAAVEPTTPPMSAANTPEAEFAEDPVRKDSMPADAPLPSEAR